MAHTSFDQGTTADANDFALHQQQQQQQPSSGVSSLASGSM